MLSERLLLWKCANSFHIFSWLQTGFYDIKTSSHLLHNEYEYIYTNKWRNLSTNRRLPTVLLLSLSSVSILNYAKLQQCQMFANLHYTKTTTKFATTATY